MEFIPENPIFAFHPDTLQALRKMYNLDDKQRLNQSIDIIEDWVRKQRHLKKEFSRDYYERKIIACKGSVEKAKSQIDQLCTLKTLLPNFFICRDIRKNTTGLIELVYCMTLPKMTDDYCRYYLIKPIDGEYTSEKVFSLFRFAVIMAEYLFRHDYLNGFHVICDLTEANLVDLLTKINFVEFQQLLSILIEAYGGRVRVIHMVSQSKIIDLFAKTVKSILPPKIANRLQIHKDLNELYKVVDKNLLPSDMGGGLQSLKELQEKWLEAVSTEENLKYLEEMVEARSDESLRQVDKFNDECLGLPGSFRSLTVD